MGKQITFEKLKILAESAKYDVSCASSGTTRANKPGGIGSASGWGICHSFADDGRCISLLKVLLTNQCEYDCAYCVNRRSSDILRAAFGVRELADLTLAFYKRNYIEGLFISSAVLRSPDYTMEQMCRAIELLRYERNFWGYIHCKAIPGASPALIHRLGLVADRMSVNIELPSESSLKRLAPSKTREGILMPMAQIREGHLQSKNELALFRGAKRFAPAGQATQMIIGATPDSDYQIMRLASGLYSRYQLRRVFYSAYIPVAESSMLPALVTKPPLLREHRLYQADFLLRQYRFGVEEILSEDSPNLNPYLDPKCNWAVNNFDFFPVDVNTAPLEMLLRVPGIGPRSAERIVASRRNGKLGLAGLKRIGVVLKRAQFFICAADLPAGLSAGRETTVRSLIDPGVFAFGAEQLSLFGASPGSLALPTDKDAPRVDHAVEEAVKCLAASL